MKRLGRWLFNLAAAVSLLLLIATSVMWILNFWIATVCGWTGDKYTVHLFTEKNLVVMRLSEYSSSKHRGLSSRIYPTPDYKMYSGGWDELSHFNSIGFPKIGIAYSLYHMPTYVPDGAQWVGFDPSKDGNKRIHTLYLPHWIIIVAGVIPIGLLIRNLRRAKRAHMGHCSRCGYDLRATPERCPECGAIPAKNETISN